ncbi:MAG: hypothetical protein KDD42_00935, partial [Bdellovibrionales bacterium]|nr:hypothetical protein [Bdellovibrionales bacterium]
MDTNPEDEVSGHNRIVLWGGKSSGKTTFAVALIKDVQDSNLGVYFADTETTNKVTDYLSKIYDHGIFPAATTVSDISSELNFDIALPDKSGARREVRISIPDIAG